MNRIAAALISLVFASARIAPGSALAACGDLNGSGAMTTADAVLLLRTVVEQPDPPGLCAGSGALGCGDLNADGAITTADVVLLFATLLGNETLLPPCVGEGPIRPCGSIISGDIAANEVWGACGYVLDGEVRVRPNVVVTIRPGAVVRARENPAPPDWRSILVLLQDSKINASGAAALPIVFTCDRPAGSRYPGCWGGLIVNGRAPATCLSSQCFAELIDNAPYGGNEANDSSGILRFVRIEFGGRGLDLPPALLTLNAVGRGTVIDHVDATQGAGDGISWSGGTANARYLVATAAFDDAFDWQDGFTGAVQHAFAAHWGGNLSTAGSHGIEGDNDADDVDATPISAPRLCNVTLIGARNQPGGAKHHDGVLLRRGTQGQILKSIVYNFSTAGLEIRDVITASNACSQGPVLTGKLMFRDGIFFANAVDALDHASTASASCSSTSLFGLYAAQAVAPVRTVDPGLPAGTGTVWSPLDPVPSSAAHSTALDCSIVDPYFDATDYVGAFAPGQPSWLAAPWVSFATD